ncbi:MAG: hypothetical protein Q8909_03520 [Bacteroidota bacterium]|nr:hypothetical protein [Bacteroidota bacterium]
MESDTTYKIELKRKTNWILAIFLLVWMIVWAVVTFGFVYSAIDWGIMEQLAFPIFCLLLSGIFVFDRLLWQLNGKEVVIIDDKIKIFKTGKLFTSKNNIELYEVSHISCSDDKKEISFMARIYGLRGGKIIIHYLGRKTRIGQSISIQEAEIIAKVLSSQIENARNKTRSDF